MALSLARIHSVVDGEVPTDHVGAGGCCVASQLIRLVFHIRRILPVVDPNGAGVALPRSIAFVKRIGPVAAVAQPCEDKFVSGGIVRGLHRKIVEVQAAPAKERRISLRRSYPWSGTARYGGIKTAGTLSKPIVYASTYLFV